MSSDSGRIRLDQILQEEGLITEEQLKDALMRQKAQGGKLGSQLLYHRYIDESGLVRALAKQFSSEGVVLSGLEIPEMILRFIPERVAVARMVIPFDYDPDNNLLKIACEDPTDKDLIDELDFVARGKKIKLYVAAEIAITTAIGKHYQGKDITLEDQLLLKIPEEATEPSANTEKVAVGCQSQGGAGSSSVLIVTDDNLSATNIEAILSADGYETTVTDSADDAIDLIGDKQFGTLFLQDTVSGDYLDLIDRVRKISPRTVVRYYESTSTLVLNQDATGTEGDLLIKNLDLFTSLLSSRSRANENHSAAVGHCADRLCRQMGLPDKDRLVITSAGFMHDLAKFYYNTEEVADPRRVVELTVKLLQSLNYSPIVVGMLHCMYVDLKGKYRKRLPIENLGGNILTVADLYCDTFPGSSKPSLDKFEVARTKFKDLVGKLFLDEVVDAFVTMIENEILSQSPKENAGQIMIYSEDPESLRAVEWRLKNEGYPVVSETTKGSFVSLYQRSQPDVLVLSLDGDPGEIAAAIEDLAELGVPLDRIPTFLLAPASIVPKLTWLFDKGVEDIITSDANTDFLVAKIRRLFSRDDASSTGEISHDPTGDSRGKLSDINLVDLLEALALGGKTVRIEVSLSNDPDRSLTLYLDSGSMAYAKVGELLGPEAVYDAMFWDNGFWTVYPIKPEDIPDRNINTSNASILMEGCRLKDERSRTDLPTLS